MTKKKVIRLLRIIMPIVGIICMVIFVPWQILTAWIAPLPDTVQQQLDKTLVDYHFDGIIVYVDKAGKAPQFYTAGYHNRATKTPAKPDALFKIGSISKLYAAAAIAQLADAKIVDLDKTLADYFPELVGRIENAEKITLKMMVQHHSGIPNYTDYPNFWDTPGRSREEALELALDLPAEFEPDEDYGYSNTNYLLLRQLIKKVTGKSHQQYIKEKILTPLALQNTYCSLAEVNMDDVMSGYYVGVEPDIKENNYGTMLATAEDVGKFIRALNDGSLFNANQQKIYTAIYKYEHSGLLPGYQSVGRYDKESDTVVILVVNTTDFNSYLFTVAEITCNRIIKILKNN